MKEETPAQRSRVLVLGWAALIILVLAGLIVMLGVILGSKATPPKPEAVERVP